MMKRRFFFLLLWTLAATTVIYSQQRTVTGRVTDASDGSMLPGVNVIVQGTTRGTVTDVEGTFQVSVSPDETLVFSFIGYQNQTMPVGNRTSLDVAMKPDYLLVNEVIVVGYGTMRRSDVTGSVTSVSREELQASVSTSLDQALQGRAAGVQVTQSSGQPGGGVSVRIRGASSIGGNNEPLYVVDGIPVTGNAAGLAMGFDWAGGGNGQNAVNALSAINPNDIVSIEVLKDASATAIYGSRASNGVVLISTRKGQSGTPRIEYNGYVGIQEIPRTIDVMNLREFAEYQNEIARENNITVDPFFSDPSILGKGTNWQKEIFRSAIIHNHDLSLTGGADKNTYAFSLGYMEQEGIVIGSGFDRLSSRLSVDSKVFDWLSLGGTMSMGVTNEQITLNDDTNGVVSLSLTQRPNVPVRMPDGSWGGPSDSEFQLTNPVAMARLRELELKRWRFMTNVYADIQLHKGLKFRTQYGTDMSFRNNYGFNPTYQLGTIVNNQNQSRRSFANNQFWIFSNFLTYEKGIFGDRLQTTTMFGAEAQESNWEGLMGGRSNFISNNIKELNAGDAATAINSQYKGSSAMESYFGRVNLNLLDRYLLTATYRADASSNFGPNNKWGYFPSMALAWRVSEESFMSNFDALSSLRIRLGYGEVGNQDIGGYTYGAALTNFPTRWGTGLLPNQFANPDVKWETTTSYNIGLDFTLFNSRIEFIGDVYLKETDDLLMRQTLPLFMGTDALSAPMVNVGKMENRGVEITLNTVNTKGALDWNSGLTFTLNRNKLTELFDDGNVIDRNIQWFQHATRSVVGKPLGQFYGYVADGIYADAAEIRNHLDTDVVNINKFNGVWPGDIKFKDLDGDGEITNADRTFIGNPEPDFTLGLNNSLKYKNFDLNVYLFASVGNEVLNFTRTMTESLLNNFNQRQVVTERAVLALKDPNLPNTDPDNVYVINPGTSVPRSSISDPNRNARISSRFVEDGSYLKIRTLSLGYTVPQRISNTVNINRARFYVNIQNLYTFTNYSGFDPEVGPFNQDALLNGIDNGNYPAPRIYSFGLNIGF